MSDSDSHFSGSIADLYERYLVPLIFIPFDSLLTGERAPARQRTTVRACPFSPFFCANIAPSTASQLCLGLCWLVQPKRQPPAAAANRPR